MTLMATKKLPYDAAHVIYRNFGHNVTAVWVADPDIAHQLKTGDDAQFDRLYLNPDLGLEVVGSIRRVRKSDGYTHSGWLLDTSDTHGDPLGTRKPEALAHLREAVANYFNR